MNFWTTGRIDIKIEFEMFQPPMLEMCNKLNTAIANKDLGNSIQNYDIIVNIFEEQPEERFRYSVTSKETDIDVNIDHDAFLKSNYRERCLLYINAIIYSVEKMRSHKKIKDFDFNQFNEILSSIKTGFEASTNPV